MCEKGSSDQHMQMSEVSKKKGANGMCGVMTLFTFQLYKLDGPEGLNKLRMRKGRANAGQ